jgi:hypothetical protein
VVGARDQRTGALPGPPSWYYAQGQPDRSAWQQENDAWQRETAAWRRRHNVHDEAPPAVPAGVSAPTWVTLGLGRTAA